MTSRLSFHLSAVLALCLLPQVSWSQFGSGIQGTVLDASSAVVPSAKVLVVNKSNGVRRETVSSAEGVYRVFGLSAGAYTVTASKEGFASAEQPEVILEANEIRKVDFTLRLGPVSQTVNVGADVPALETEQGRISSQISATQLKELPVPNRNLINLLALQPGITGHNLGNDMFGSDATPVFNANGTRADGNSYTLDDSNISSISRGGRAEVTPNVETVAEVRITTNNFSAEQGRNMGAQVSVVTKSGSNQFHGSVWDYHTDNALQARNFFVKSVPVNRRNQFGFGVGGPIVRNRTFFFFSYEGARRSGNTTQTSVVETQQLRDYVLSTRPNSIAAYFLSNFRPVADPTFAFLNAGLPFPAVGQVQYLTTTDDRSNQYTVRVDHELRPGKDRLYAYWYRLNARSITPGLRTNLLRFNPTTGTFGNLVYSRTISPTAVNEARLSVVRFSGQYCVPKNPAHPFGDRSCNDILHKELPGLNITGLGGTVRDVNVFPGGWFPTEYQLKDTFAMEHGTHALKFGGEIRRAFNILWHTASFIPVYSFGSVSDFVNDKPSSMTRTVDPRTGLPTTTRADMAIWEGAVFAQDDWKVRRNLTLNLGLRYEYFGPYTDTHNRFRNFVPGTGSSYAERLANGKVDVTSRGWDPDMRNFAPRFGFAWDLGGQGKNVIRGGYGISYDRLATVQTAVYRTNPPLAAQAQLGQQFHTTFTYTLGDPAKPYLGYPIDPGLRLGLDPHNGIAGARVAIEAIDRNIRQPYTHNWFLGAQHSLPGQIVVEANWVGSAGHHLLNISNVNRFTGDLYPSGQFHGFNSSFSSINMARTTSNSIYHGATLAVRRQFSRGLSFQANYTYGKVITNSELEQGVTSFYDVNNPKLDRSVASFDVPQRVAFSGVWELPFLRHCASWLCKTAGGWQFSGYGVLEKGTPLDVFTTADYQHGGDYNADGTNFDRPNAPGSSISRSGFSKQDFLRGIFYVSDFPVPAPASIGTLGRNAFRGPGFARVDLSLAKDIHITERVGSSLRVESFNAFNRVNLNAPSTNLTSNTFGRSITAADARTYMLSLRVSF